QAVKTLSELGRDVEAVVTCLPTSREVEQVASELMHAMPPGSLLVDCTSGDPASSRRIAAMLAEQGIGFVDAPVSGGPPLAATGQLTVMCGGSETDVARAAEVVAPFAAKVVRMGPVGSGHAMKAVNNILLAVNIIAAGEGLVALAKLGIDPRAAVDVLNASSGSSFASEALIPERVLSGTWPRMFRLALLEKDAGIAVDTAGDAGTEHPLLDFVREQLRQLRAELGESADYLDPIRRAEQRAGVELRG
ncbi:MAG TPA: NAD(P)-dependent oxidoreductase, partial [Gemmatimonadales bacterium]|nr:NAD(P)-dependent oxidoreductase [Gemmatimonadales bacterium]